jgi:hypothetical protein
VRVRLAVLILSLTVLVTGVPGATIPLATTGSPSPLGLPFSSFNDVSVMADGRVVFLGSSTGAFRRSGDQIVHVVAAGDTLADGAVVAGVSAPALGPGGCVAVRAFLVGGGSRILRSCQSGMDVVVQTGDPAPDGRTFAEFVAGVAYGAGGQIAFTAILDDGTTGLFRDDAGVRTTIARTGGSPSSGLVLTALRLIGVTADGRVGFRGSVASGRDGLFLSTSDLPLRVVEVGEATPVGGTFRSVSNASMNDAGAFAFRADLSDGTGGVFRVDTSGPLPVVRAVVREGDSVSGDQVSVRTLPSSLTPSINVGAAVAYRATLTGAESGSAIFIATPDGVTTRVLAARDRTAVGVLVRLRDPVLADDGSLVVPASVTGGGPSLFLYRSGAFSELARIGTKTDIDTGLERFRFSQASVRGAAEGGVFVGSRDGIFVASRNGALETAAFVGGPTPLGGTFAGFDPPAAEASGIVVFGAEIRGSGEASRAIITRKSGRLRIAAQSTERIKAGRLVDFFSGTLDPLAHAGVGPHGEIAFEATLEGGKTPRAILFRRGGKPQPMARAGRSAPGGGEFDTFGTPAVLHGRTMAFVGQVGSGDSRRAKMFLYRGGNARALAAEGGGAPGRLGGRFETFEPPDANGKLIAFRATLDQAGREGVFLASPRSVGVLVGTGDAAPDGTFRACVSPSLGGSVVVFLGRLVGAPASPGLFRVRADAVPAADATAPQVDVVGAPAGASPLGGTLGEFGSFDLNRSDQLAVVVDLVGASARSALFLVDAGGALVP